MLIRRYYSCFFGAAEFGLTARVYAHKKRVSLELLDASLSMFRFREGKFIDESVAAGVAR